MDLRLVGEWDGTPEKYDRFSEKLLEPVCREFFKDDTLVVLYNHHLPEMEVTDETLEVCFRDFISANVDENRNKVFIVNWGWHHRNDGGADIRSYMDSLRLCNSNAVSFSGKDLKPNEYVFKNKNGIALATWRITDKGYSVLYFLWDAFHVTSDSAVSEWKKEILPFAINQFAAGVFLEKYGEMVLEGKQDKRLVGRTFTSISDKARQVVGKDGEKAVIEEMIDKAPVKEITLFLNQVANCKNTQNARRSSKVIFVTKEQVRKWLLPWAEKKWPYYVMFGHQFSISHDIHIALRPDKDEALIKSMLGDFKRKFIKYAPILDMFSTQEFLSNTVRSHDQLTKYRPVKSGEKLSRYLSSFFDDKEFDVELSKFIQNKEVHSVAHISINPMDFMTASVTKHDWHSCHALHDGEYALGSLSYMFDEGSLIAFMASDREYTYDLDGKGKPFAWNSKSWRQMVYGSIKDNMFIFSREYPQHYQNDAITTEVRTVLEHTIAEFCDIPSVWVKKNNGAKNSMGTIYTNAKNAKHYDDIPRNQTVLIRHKMNMDISGPIVIGSCPACPISGKLLTNSNRVVFDSSVL